MRTEQSVVHLIKAGHLLWALKRLGWVSGAGLLVAVAPLAVHAWVFAGVWIMFLVLVFPGVVNLLAHPIELRRLVVRL